MVYWAHPVERQIEQFQICILSITRGGGGGGGVLYKLLGGYVPLGL